MKQVRAKADELLGAYAKYRGTPYFANEWTLAKQKARSSGGVVSSCDFELLYDTAKCARVDLDDLAENFLGAEISISPLKHLDVTAGAEVLGKANPTTRSIAVCPRVERYEPLYRATLAHEVAHLVLHPHLGLRELAYAPNSQKRPHYELEADEFMANLLMPAGLIEATLAVVSAVYRIRMEWLCDVNSERGRHLWKQHVLRMFLNTLCISREFALVRASRTFGMSYETCAYHRTYSLPNRWAPPGGFASTPMAHPISEALTDWGL
jgi:hypothetical protein